MLNSFFGVSYDLNNGICTIDGVLQSSAQPCEDAIKGILGIILSILIPLIILSLVFFAFWIITLIHVSQHKNVPSRVFWIIAHIVSIFIAFPWLVTIIYYFVVMRPYNKTKKNLPASPGTFQPNEPTLFSNSNNTPPTV